jgi:RNA polymerase sigma-70 factor (ECF subfamily)
LASREPSDEELMARIVEHDADAFDVLAARYERILARHLFGILRDDDAARDLVQEALLRVWTHAHQWDGLGSPRRWLLKIANNLALNYIRTVRRRRERPLDVPAESGDDDEYGAPEWMIDDSSPRPDEALELAEQRRLLRRLMDSLPDDKREVLLLVYEADADIREAAGILGIPEGTVKSRLHSARQRLASEWRSIEPEWEDV